MHNSGVAGISNWVVNINTQHSHNCTSTKAGCQALANPACLKQH
jgi:hypothetical protein